MRLRPMILRVGVTLYARSKSTKKALRLLENCFLLILQAAREQLIARATTRRDSKREQKSINHYSHSKNASELSINKKDKLHRVNMFLSEHQS